MQIDQQQRGHREVRLHVRHPAAAACAARDFAAAATPMKRAGEHRVLHRVVHVRHRALVEVLGEVERDDVGVAEVGVLLAVRPGPVLARRLLQPGQREREQGQREQHPQRRPEPAQPDRAVPAPRPADRPAGHPHHRVVPGRQERRPPVRRRIQRPPDDRGRCCRRRIQGHGVPGGNGAPVRVARRLRGRRPARCRRRVGAGRRGGRRRSGRRRLGPASPGAFRRRGRRRRRRRLDLGWRSTCGAGRNDGLTSTWSVSWSSGLPFRYSFMNRCQVPPGSVAPEHRLPWTVVSPAACRCRPRPPRSPGGEADHPGVAVAAGVQATAGCRSSTPTRARRPAGPSEAAATGFIANVTSLATLGSIAREDLSSCW